MQTPARPKHKKEDIARAISRFFAVRGLIRTRVAEGAKIDASTWLRFEVLKFIMSHNAPRVKDIAEYLSVTAPSATALVRGLVRDGLVIRKIDKRDRRASCLVLTKKGKRALATAMERSMTRLEGFFAVLSAEELECFIGFLERIIAAA